MKYRRTLFALGLSFALAACVGPSPSLSPSRSPSAPPSATATLSPAPTSINPTTSPTGSPAACTPTDQDAYVYHPARLKVLAACTYASGVVAAIRTEADGDRHILVMPDPPYAGLVNAANSGVELGDLVVEPVCVGTVTQADAIAICATDPDPLDMSGLAIGQHVWLTGRYVNDLDHGGWAELHPLYAWGLLAGSGLRLPNATPAPIDDEAP